MTNNATVHLLNQSALEPVSVKGFGDFLKNNIPLVIAVSAAFVFSFGAGIFWYQEGAHPDTLASLADYIWFKNAVIKLGRFGSALLLSLVPLQRQNPFALLFVSFFLHWFASLSWCYIIAIFNGGGAARNNRLIPFALLFLTQPVWADAFIFYMEWSRVIPLAICPYTVYFLYKGFLDNEKKPIICAVASLVFMVAIYEVYVTIVCGGIFACFLLLQERTDFEPKVYSRLCLKLLLALLMGGALYYLINRLIIFGLLGFTADHGLTNFIVRWGQRPVIQSILAILLYGYTLTIGQIPFVQSIVHPIMASFIAAHEFSAIPPLPVEEIANLSRVFGNVLLLPAAILFLVSIAQKAHRVIPKGRRLLYVLAGIGVPFTIIMLSLMAGARTHYRSSVAFCFAAAFMVYYLLRVWNKKAAYVLTILALIVSVRQAQITAQLYYSDHLRFIADSRLAVELDQLIKSVQPDNQKLPVALVGVKDTLADMPPYVIHGDIFVKSIFSFDFYGGVENHVGIWFMRGQGIYYDTADERQWDAALAEAELMPSYPAPGCVKRLSDVVVVKLSNPR